MDKFKLLLVQANPTVGAVGKQVENVKNILSEYKDVDLIVFSESYLSGYQADDLVLRGDFLDVVSDGIESIREEVMNVAGPAVLVGAPIAGADLPYNAAILIRPDGSKQIARKLDLPNDGPFDERRTFAPGEKRGPFVIGQFRIGVGICEEMWHGDVARHHGEHLADFLLFINGSPYTRGKHRGDRLAHARRRVSETHLPLVYLNMVGGQDELVFDGGSFCLDRDGTQRVRLPAFQEAMSVIEFHRRPDGTVGFDDVVKNRRKALDGSWHDIDSNVAYPNDDAADYLACVLGTRDYVNKSGYRDVVLGLSGGIDSALVAAIATDALGPQHVHPITLPYWRDETDDSEDDALLVARSLGLRLETVSIRPVVESFRQVTGHLYDRPRGSVAQQNHHPRARMMVLMDASKEFGRLLLTTGNKSETAVGYCTLYGDMAGGFNPIKDFYKTRVWELSKWRSSAIGWESCCEVVYGGRFEVPEKVIVKAPSAGLEIGQTDEAELGPYAILDAILMSLVDEQRSVEDTVVRLRHAFPDEVFEKWVSVAHVKWVAKQVDISEHKRRQAPPGPKITSKAFGRDRRYPIVNKFRL